jgi:hypothetical protein
MTEMMSEAVEKLYKRFKYDELTFSETIRKSSGIIQKSVVLKAGDKSWPCTIISASMTGIKLTVKFTENNAALLKAQEQVSVHFSFIGFKPQFIPLAFSVPYQLSDEAAMVALDSATYLLTLSCQGKPPEFLIRILGELLNIHAVTTKRAEVRISVNRTTAADLKLKSLSAVLQFGETRKECTLRDLSFSGCQVQLDNSAPLDKMKITLEILFQDPDTLCEIEGTVMRYSRMKGSTSSGTAGILFDSDLIPHEYTERLHSILD